MSECRNCGSAAIRDLGFVGEVAPFFLKRVFNLETRTVLSVTPAKRFIQAITTVPQKALSRIHRTAALAEIQACTSCSFVQTKHGFSDESLKNLYRDYRSDTYNRERIQYEPSYRRIAEQVGSGPKETETRIETLTAWLRDRIVPDGHFSMLDYGGADGRFLPRLPSDRKHVFDISDVAATDGVLSIRNEADLGAYSYIQLAHILEHVPRPLDMVRKVSRWLAPGGYLYIEVPQDFSDTKVSQMMAGTYRGSVPIHEHINLYTKTSITKLIESAGLQTSNVEAVSLDLGWMKTTNIRGLGRLPEL
jgi:hypothetical protein